MSTELTPAMMTRRQPLAARIWGTCYRTWWPPDSPRHKRKAKRRSSKRGRQQARRQISDDRQSGYAPVSRASAPDTGRTAPVA